MEQLNEIFETLVQQRIDEAIRAKYRANLINIGTQIVKR